MPVLKLIKILAIPLIASYLLACAEQANRLENLTPSCVFPNKQVAPGWICGKAVTGVTIQQARLSCLPRALSRTSAQRIALPPIRD